jgi:hypothetical protein
VVAACDDDDGAQRQAACSAERWFATTARGVLLEFERCNF